MAKKGRIPGTHCYRFQEHYPTEELRQKHHAYLVHQAQARFRGEPHDLTESEYFELWGDLWSQRGKRGDSLTMTRCDPEGAWTRDNIEIVTRREQLSRNLAFGKHIRK